MLIASCAAVISVFLWVFNGMAPLVSGGSHKQRLRDSLLSYLKGKA